MKITTVLIKLRFMATDGTVVVSVICLTSELKSELVELKFKLE